MMDLLKPDYDSLDYIAKWVSTSWRNTAAAAYAHYLESGRGVYFIDLANATPAPEYFVNGLRARCDYLPADTLEQHHITKTMPSLAALVLKYDPERFVLFLFSRRTGPAVSFIARDRDERVTPPQAYEDWLNREPLPAEVLECNFGQG